MALAARLALKSVSFKASMRHEVMGAASPKRVHVVILYILRAQRGSHIIALGPECILYSYLDPLGLPYQPRVSCSSAGC